MDHFDRISIFPDAFAWSAELLAELDRPHQWEDVAGFLDAECAVRLVSDDYYENRQGKQLFVRDLPPLWTERLRQLIEDLSGYTGRLMQPRVVVYSEGEEFREHTDFPHLRYGMVRTHTFCAYLTEPIGGELAFNHGVSVRPAPGLAVIFDPTFVHCSRPVSSGAPKALIVTWFLAEAEQLADETIVIQAGDVR